MVSRTGKILRFGVYTLDSASGDLHKSGIPLKLQPQPLKVLQMLVERGGELVAREEIQAEIWGDSTHVDFEKGLNFCIKKIRESLNDEADAPRYIETIPKRGYRFIYPVEAVDTIVGTAAIYSDSTSDSPPAYSSTWVSMLVLVVLGLAIALAWFTQEVREPSLAVLPFEDLSEGAAPEGFVAGMTDILTTELSKIEPLRVISRVTMEQYRDTDKSLPEIAEELKVDSIVEGSVLFEGDRVRINVQLIQASPERHIWADAFDREVSDVLKIHAEVADAIARQIEGVMVPESGPRSKVNPEVLIAYLKGRGFIAQRTPEKIAKGLEYFDQAITLDPEFAPAHGGRADAYALLGSVPFDVIPPRDAMPLARDSALRALELDDTLAEAYTTLGYVHMVFDHDWQKAEENFQRALSLNANYVEAHHWYSYCLRILGRPAEAMSHAETGRRLDPNSLATTASVAWHHYLAREYELAATGLQETLEIDADFPTGRFDLGMVYTQMGLHDEADAEFERALGVAPDCTICKAGRAYNYARAGRIEEAHRLVDELLLLSETRYVPGFYLAAVYGALRQNADAIHWMEMAYEQRTDYVVYAGIEPSFDSIRGDPRFQELLDRVLDKRRSEE